MVQYGTAAEARKRAHNMNDSFYTDAEIDTILTNYSNNLHLVLGKALTGEDFTSSDIEFSTANIYTINATACQMLGSVNIEKDTQEDCDRESKAALDSLQGSGSSFAIASDHYEINDGLDEDLYMQRDP